MRFTLDTNVLFYAVDRDEDEKRAIAKEILNRAPDLDFILTAQVLGEFLNAVRRKKPVVPTEAIRLVEIWSSVFPIASTSPSHIFGGWQLSMQHKLQFWDSVILEIARSERVGIVLTEDMDDGRSFGGIKLLNPFLAKNRAELDILLKG